MTRILACVLIFGIGLAGQPVRDIQSTLIALKDPNAPRKALSDQLVDQMMAIAKRGKPSRAAVERFSEDFTIALLGKDVTAIRASVLQRAISDLMSGRGSNFEPASKLRDTLNHCGISPSTVRMIVDRFVELGQEVRGPDDTGVQPPLRLK